MLKFIFLFKEKYNDKTWNILEYVNDFDSLNRKSHIYSILFERVYLNHLVYNFLIVYIFNLLVKFVYKVCVIFFGTLYC